MRVVNREGNGAFVSKNTFIKFMLPWMFGSVNLHYIKELFRNSNVYSYIQSQIKTNLILDKYE